VGVVPQLREVDTEAVVLRGLLDDVLHLGAAVDAERDPAGGLADRRLPGLHLEQVVAVLDDAEQDDEQQRQDECELHGRGTPVGEVALPRAHHVSPRLAGPDFSPLSFRTAVAQCAPHRPRTVRGTTVSAGSSVP
jgi:hypothetical protein